MCNHNGVRLLQFFLNLILTFGSKVDIILVMNYAWMAELADAHGLSPCGRYRP